MCEVRPISKLLLDFQGSLAGDTISIAEVMEAFHERGFGILLLIFAMPMALPLPVPPGINIALATPLIFLTVQQMLGRRHVWLPKAWRKKNISKAKMDSILGSAIPFLQKLEILTKPRLSFLTTHHAQMVIGFLGLMMALTACIPLPLTNTVPSFAIVIMALGVLMRDGLAVSVGALIGVTWVSMLAVAAFLFGTEGIDMIKEAIKSWL